VGKEDQTVGTPEPTHKETGGKLQSYKTLVGGGFMDEKVCRYVGADYWAKDAMSGVRYCQKLTPPL
jgi:methanogenic corrinoid protein MtbC1